MLYAAYVALREKGNAYTNISAIHYDGKGLYTTGELSALPSASLLSFLRVAYPNALFMGLRPDFDHTEPVSLSFGEVARRFPPDLNYQVEDLARALRRVMAI